MLILYFFKIYCSGIKKPFYISNEASENELFESLNKFNFYLPIVYQNIHSYNLVIENYFFKIECILNSFFLKNIEIDKLKTEMIRTKINLQFFNIVHNYDFSFSVRRFFLALEQFMQILLEFIDEPNFFLDSSNLQKINYLKEYFDLFNSFSTKLLQIVFKIQKSTPRIDSLYFYNNNSYFTKFIIQNLDIFILKNETPKNIFELSSSFFISIFVPIFIHNREKMDFTQAFYSSFSILKFRNIQKFDSLYEEYFFNEQAVCLMSELFFYHFKRLNFCSYDCASLFQNFNK